MQEYEKIVEILDEYVRADEIKPDDNFKSDLDMSSFELIGFAGDVKDIFGVQLTVDDFLNNPTVIEMAQHIVTESRKNAK